MKEKQKMVEANNSEEKLTASDIKIISDMLTKHIEKEYDLEAIWLLYLLIETNNINAESYLSAAWDNFAYIVQWCNNHIILSIAGVNITFLNLPITILIFLFISFAIDEIFFN